MSSALAHARDDKLCGCRGEVKDSGRGRPVGTAGLTVFSGGFTGLYPASPACDRKKPPSHRARSFDRKGYLATCHRLSFIIDEVSESVHRTT